MMFSRKGPGKKEPATKNTCLKWFAAYRDVEGLPDLLWSLACQKKNYMKSLADGTDESRSLEDYKGSHLLLLHDKRSHP
jgi:hypothetical protein